MARRAIHCIISCIILLLSVERMMTKIDAMPCMEGLVTVDVTCRGSEADKGCWVACQHRHGEKAQAWCQQDMPGGVPGKTCMCTYDCPSSATHSGAQFLPIFIVFLFSMTLF